MSKSDASIEILMEKTLVSLEEMDYVYEIPDNWIWIKSEFIARWGSGGTPSRKNPHFYEGEIPWIKTGELKDNILVDSQEKISEEALKNSSAKLYPNGSVIIAMYGATIGKLGILGIDATTNQACAVGVPNTLTDKYFMFYYFLFRRKDLISKGKGGAQPNISQAIIKEFPYVLPPLDEQKRIVEKIRRLFLKIDEASRLVSSLPLEDLKNAILYKAFTGDLGTNNPNESSSYEPLKQILREQLK